MSEERSRGEWFNALPRTDRIYRLIEQVHRGEREESRVRAIDALGESGDPRAVQALVACTYDESAEVRKHATRALCKLGSVRGVRALNDRLRDRKEEWDTRKLAAEGLREIRSYSAIEFLVERLLDRREEAVVRTHIAGVLAETGCKRAYRALSACLSDENQAVRKAAEVAFRVLDLSRESLRE